MKRGCKGLRFHLFTNRWKGEGDAKGCGWPPHIWLWPQAAPHHTRPLRPAHCNQHLDYVTKESLSSTAVNIISIIFIMFQQYYAGEGSLAKPLLKNWMVRVMFVVVGMLRWGGVDLFYISQRRLYQPVPFLTSQIKTSTSCRTSRIGIVLVQSRLFFSQKKLSQNSHTINDHSLC